MGQSITERYATRKRRKLMNEINVTPMVDVMLVLLIIFMITTPMLVGGIEVDLPKTDASPVSSPTNPLVISIKKNGDLFIFETKIAQKDIIQKLKNVTKENKDTRIFIKGDKNVQYGTIVKTMSYIHNAGFTKIALLSDMNEK